MLRYLLGWSALLLATLFSCFWAFWGCVEYFHEGFYLESILLNLLSLLIRYIPYVIIAVILNLIAIRNKWIGGIIYLSLGIVILYWFMTKQYNFIYRYWIEYIILLSFLPFIGFSLIIGKTTKSIQGRQFCNIIAIGLPVFIFSFVSVIPVQRFIEHYKNDTKLQEDSNLTGIYEVKYDEHTIIQWAPQGAGWSPFGRHTWKKAYEICKFLDEKGENDNSRIPNYKGSGWRLPTPEEVKFSFRSNEKNTWKYDKRDPLWKFFSPAVQYWCQYNNENENQKVLMADDNKDAEHKYVPTVNYTGEVIYQKEDDYNESIGFRAVRIIKDGKVFNNFLDIDKKMIQ